ncbi:hypothetical protein LOTGIDRAFT_182203 [Lottia gigantea]|uniref:Serine palmitoyltransferase 1 n=1 Tax=Lottia gigantea TaxID=225164 RepID=V4AJN2_LOTGI|nr:hypothetical protein LOTGIDRAFT_182203 [Lottia gigantea]ESO93781.1 hypothetical protein LOTGIDRAFT_182203 [Lottia gigantea]
METLPATWDMYDLFQSFLRTPTYHLIVEVCLVLLIIKLIFSKSYKPEKTVLSEKEKDELIAEWTPEPLVPDIPEDHPIIKLMEKNIVTGPPGKYINIRNKSCINMATMNFLGMISNKTIEEEAVRCIKKYGVGSCGPRGFYGTMDVHLELESHLAKFMNCEEAIIYSYGFATISSAIPAYSKRGDIIYCDEGVSFAIQKGLAASRSEIRFFKHNDTEDLERLLIEQQQKDKKNPKKAKVTRRFIVIEGLYLNYGDICPLPKIVELKWKYKVRIFMEESFSFGVLGSSGKGVTEYYGIDIDEIDLIAASLENAISSIGGFCVGKKYVIDHQRLSGLGYCFSASQPPLLAAAATQALGILEKDPGLVTQLKENCLRVHEGLNKIEGVQIVGLPFSPVKHIRLVEPSDDRDLDIQTLELVADRSIENGVACTVARYLEKEEKFLPPPSIRIAVNCQLNSTEIDRVVTVLNDSFNQVFSL